MELVWAAGNEFNDGVPRGSDGWVLVPKQTLLDIQRNRVKRIHDSHKLAVTTPRGHVAVTDPKDGSLFLSRYDDEIGDMYIALERLPIDDAKAAIKAWVLLNIDVEGLLGGNQ